MLQRYSTTKICSRVLANFLGLLEHPPYSPDLAPIDFRVFPEIKGNLPDMRLEDATELCIYTQNFVSSYNSDYFSESNVWLQRHRKFMHSDL